MNNNCYKLHNSWKEHEKRSVSLIIDFSIEIILIMLNKCIYCKNSTYSCFNLNNNITKSYNTVYCVQHRCRICVTCYILCHPSHTFACSNYCNKIYKHFYDYSICKYCNKSIFSHQLCTIPIKNKYMNVNVL